MRRFLRLLVAVVLVAAVTAWEFQRRLQVPLQVPAEGFVLTVAPGDSLRSVAGKLATAGILPYPRIALLYGRWSGADARIKQGEYQLPLDLTVASLLELLQSGKVIQYQVTLPEGITLARALEILAAAEGIAPELAGTGDPRIVELSSPHDSPEGLFFPDSYRFTRGTRDWELLQRARRMLQEVLSSEWEQRREGLPYETPYEALVMASIIERETGVAEERGEIAGVFVRRLQKGMRLQTDPTVIYGLGEDFDGNLTRKHLRDESNLYNTYRHSGLPPSPISLPGRASINAALNPAEGEALYFVARGDGSHEFSATLAEHEAAVRKYQLKRRADYRSSPQ